MKLDAYKKYFLAFLTVTVVLCSIPELILIQLKYRLFTGADNFPYPLLSLIERLAFILFFIMLNILLFAIIFVIVSRLLRFFKIAIFNSYFHAMMICIIGAGFVMVLQFQLHVFFADAMDAALITNIVGGDIRTALVYVMDEIMLLIIGAALLVGLYVVCSRFVLIRFAPKSTDVPSSGYQRNYLIVCSLMFIVWLPGSIYAVNSIDPMRYNLGKTNAYKVFSSSLDYISDIDGDGVGSFSYPQDFNVFNRQQYPGALEIPNNGIDENGLFGDLLLTLSSETIDYTTQKTPKHIVIVIMESTRYDAINKSIDGRLVAPNLSLLAQEGKSISQAYSHTGYTGPSLASFFSGYIGNFNIEHSMFSILKRQGYQLALFSGQDEAWGNLDKKLATRKTTALFFDAQAGKDERVFDSVSPASIKLNEKTLWQQFEKYSATLDWQKPQFVYFNMQAAHFPYFHSSMTKTFVTEGIPRHKIGPSNKLWLRKTYWNAIHHADIYLGKIISELKRKGIWQDTLLIVAGDHGEELFENDHLGHGSFISEVQTRIPIVTNQVNFQAAEPVGQSDMKDNILSYAIGSSKYPIKVSTKKSVFQMVGGLSSPAKIAFRYSHDQQLTLDLKNMLVRPVGKVDWIPYHIATADSEINSDLQALVTHWEMLRWNSQLTEHENVY